MNQKLGMRPNNTPGFLITFCGLDGCGKTTMINRVVKDYSFRIPTFLTKQPTDFVRSSGIFRTFMDSPDNSEFDYRSLSLLAASDRLQHCSKLIEPLMNRGYLVISDRYFYSCLANLRARGYENDKWIYEIAESIIKPDLAFFLDIPVEKAIERVRSRKKEKDRYIDEELQYRLREQYRDICLSNGGVLISTYTSEEQTYEKINKNIERLFDNEC